MRPRFLIINISKHGAKEIGHVKMARAYLYQQLKAQRDDSCQLYSSIVPSIHRTNRQLIKMKQVRETSYLTILRPTLEYAAMVCDPTT